jgi:hypothetical protein
MFSLLVATEEEGSNQFKERRKGSSLPLRLHQRWKEPAVRDGI